MKRGLFFVLTGVLVAAALIGARHLRTRRAPPVPAAAGKTQADRIVSMSPSVTETLHALGLMERVVGVTRFCTFPPEVRTLPRVGGYVDPSYEAIVRLRPDLVILRRENGGAATNLAKVGIKTLGIDHTSLDGVVQSISDIGAACGAEAKAAEVVAGIRTELDAIGRRNRFAKPPRVLISVGRSMGSRSLKDVYAAGKEGLYDEALRLAGARNACAELSAPYPRLDAETILRLDPDIIVDLCTRQDAPEARAAIMADWESVPNLRAAREGRIRIMTEDYITVPGPRFVLFIRDLAAFLADTWPADAPNADVPAPDNATPPAPGPETDDA